MRKQSLRAFTLVEILIVVVILGILAAIVVPQFTKATSDAQTGNLKAQKKSLQNQLELYRARNNVYPTLAQMQSQGPAAAGDWGVLINGNYIKNPPKNPFNSFSTVAAGVLNANQIDMTGVANKGWAYDAATGTISPCYYDETTEQIDALNP